VPKRLRTQVRRRLASGE